MAEPFQISKVDSAERLVFGWANVSVTADGQPVIDLQQDMIAPADLEKAAYDYALAYRGSGVMHKGESIGTMVESVVFTPEKLVAMGLAKDAVQPRWWIGFKIHDDATFAKVQAGTLSMFSIQGKANREEVAA